MNECLVVLVDVHELEFTHRVFFFRLSRMVSFINNFMLIMIVSNFPTVTCLLTGNGVRQS